MIDLTYGAATPFPAGKILIGPTLTFRSLKTYGTGNSDLGHLDKKKEKRIVLAYLACHW